MRGGRHRAVRRPPRAGAARAAPRQLAAWLAVAAPLPVRLAGGEAADEDRAYTYLSYGETLQYFDDLKRQCPGIVDTWIAQDEFPEILPAADKNWASCGSDGTCRTLVVRLTNRSALTPTTPELFFSGALHGDEIMGPLVVTELAGLLCRGYLAGDEDIRRLVDGRSIWIAPMTNAHGFRWHRREENHMDPNRDFPYLQPPHRCMTTQTARAVNELFRRHLFQFMLTFHGGMRALTYEWGSRNHMVRVGRSTESPDDRAFVDVGGMLQQASGFSEGGKVFYPMGRITDAVYAVDGGMEDWSYGAGFEASPTPITVCKPQTYGGYAAERTVYKPGSLSALVYLAEMDDLKSPPASALGRTSELRRPGARDGHVARNLRMCLKLIELTRPEVLVQPPAWSAAWQPGAVLPAVQVRGVGCKTFTVRLLLLPRARFARPGDGCALAARRAGGFSDAAREALLASGLRLAEAAAAACGGLAAWPSAAAGAEVRLEGAVPATAAAGEYCAVVAAEFDQDWRTQRRPDPALPPQSHAARVRVDEHYVAQATEGPMRIDEYRTKLFPVSTSPVRVVGAAGGAAGSAGFLAAAAVPADASPPKAPPAAAPGVAAPTRHARNPGTGAAARPSALPSGARSDGDTQGDFARPVLWLLVFVAGGLFLCNVCELRRRCARASSRRFPRPARRPEAPTEIGAPKAGPAE